MGGMRASARRDICNANTRSYVNGAWKCVKYIRGEKKLKKLFFRTYNGSVSRKISAFFYQNHFQNNVFAKQTLEGKNSSSKYHKISEFNCQSLEIAVSNFN